MQKNDVIYYEFRKIDSKWIDVAHPAHTTLSDLFFHLRLNLPDDSITYCLYYTDIAFVQYLNCFSKLSIYVKYH